MAQHTTHTIGTATIKDDESGGLTLSGNAVIIGTISAGGEIFTEGNIRNSTFAGTNEVETDILTVTNDADIGGSLTTATLETSLLNVRNVTGDEICGTATHTALGVTTISTTQAKTGSIILFTPHTNTPDGEFYVASISNGVSFTYGYTGASDPQSFYWFIINPV